MVNDIAWADTSATTTLAAESRLRPFFEKHGLDFQSLATVVYTAGKLKDLLMSGALRQSHIMHLNELFPDGAIKIEKDIMQGSLKSGRNYSYAIFRFEKERKTINVLFIRDHDKLTDDELSELRIKKDEVYHLDCTGLEGVWFVNPNLAIPAPEVKARELDAALKHAIEAGRVVLNENADRESAEMQSFVVSIDMVNKALPDGDSLDKALPFSKLCMQFLERNFDGKDLDLKNARSDVIMAIVYESSAAILSKVVDAYVNKASGARRVIAHFLERYPAPAAPAGNILASIPEAQAEADRIHDENLKPEYMPTIPDKTILCHIITDSIVPVEQQNMLKVALEQNMEREAEKGTEYRDGFACLSGANANNPDEYIKDLQNLMQKKRDDYKALGYADVRFDVACPDTGLVSAVLGSNLGVKALAFKPCKGADFNLMQVEGIMLALRALDSGDVEKLKSVFTFLSGNRLSPEQSAINDIDKFIKTVPFILPAAKIENYNERRRINDLITANIKQAA